MGVQRLVDALDPHEDWVVLQIDVSNAFNSLSREALLMGCRKKSPGLFNWLSFCYGQKFPLFCQGNFLCWSQKGVHLGDACGPSAFALGLDVALDVNALQTLRIAGASGNLGTWMMAPC